MRISVPVKVWVRITDADEEGNDDQGIRDLLSDPQWRRAGSKIDFVCTATMKDAEVVITDSLDVTATALGGDIPVVYVGDRFIVGQLVTQVNLGTPAALLNAIQHVYVIAEALMEAQQPRRRADLAGAVRFVLLDDAN